MSKEVLKLALDHSEPSILSPGWTLVRNEDITALREALEEQPERPYRQLQDNGSKYFGESWDKAEQPAQGCDHCNHPLYAGTKCKNCGHVTEQAEQAQPVEHTYASTQATMCAGCGEHKHTPLRIDAMGGYVCLTCIDKKLGSLLGEFGYPKPEQAQPVAWMHQDTLAAMLTARAGAKTLRYPVAKLTEYDAKTNFVPLYITPPPRQPACVGCELDPGDSCNFCGAKRDETPRQWIGLTTLECLELMDATHPKNRWPLLHLCEAKLKEKNT